MEHIDPEDLSAYLDEELEQSDHSRVSEHISSCDRCTGQLAAMQGVSSAVARLGAEAEIPPEDLAVLRQAVPPKRSSTWTGRWWVAGLGAIGLAAVVGIMAITMLPSQRQADLSSIQQESARPITFASDQQVRSVVEQDPDIRAAVGRWTVSDVGNESDEGSLAAGRAGDPAPAPPTTAADCSKNVVSSQPYPMKPVMARPALFRGVDSWLLVYAFTPEREPDAPLDRFQIWIVRTNDCSTLHYSFFRPKQSD